MEELFKQKEELEKQLATLNIVSICKTSGH